MGRSLLVRGIIAVVLILIIWGWIAYSCRDDGVRDEWPTTEPAPTPEPFPNQTSESPGLWRAFETQQREISVLRESLMTARLNALNVEQLRREKRELKAQVWKYYSQVNAQTKIINCLRDTVSALQSLAYEAWYIVGTEQQLTDGKYVIKRGRVLCFGGALVAGSATHLSGFHKTDTRLGYIPIPENTKQIEFISQHSRALGSIGYVQTDKGTQKAFIIHNPQDFWKSRILIAMVQF